MVADKMYEVAMVIDKKIVKHREYRLIRHHILDENGTLYVYYYTTDKSGNEEYLAEWEHYKNDNVAYYNANNIGVAYYKSPQDSRGLSQWGVPLNFGCEEVEEEIRTARKDLNEEMKLMKAKLFADKSITLAERTKEGARYDLPEGIYTIQKRAGVDGTLIDEFAPSTRYNDYKQKLNDALQDWENQVGLDRGFLTEQEHTAGATATEIRTANTKTRSFVKKIQSAMFDGIKATLEADAVFLNIPLDLYTVMVDWFDTYEDYDKQYERIVSAVDRGVLEKEDELRWLYPNMTDEEIAEKLARISAQAQTNTDQALERILAGQ
jgi:A118 family predicted phage portal protein